MFSNILRLWSEARGTVLLNELQDAILRLNNASPETRGELSITLNKEISSLENQVGSLTNVSHRYKKKLAAEYRNTAQTQFDRNLGRAYALAVISIYLEAQARPGPNAARAAALSEEMIEAARRVPEFEFESFAHEQRRVLLAIAKKIREAENTLDKMLIVTSELTAAGIELSRKHGDRAVEKNCPAMQILFGLSGEGNRERAKVLFDELLRDLEDFKDNESMTWLRMAWMLTPKAIEAAMHENDQPN